MKLKNVLPIIAVLLVGLMSGCKKDVATIQAIDPVAEMPLFLKSAPVGSPVATHGQVYVSGKNMKDASGATMNLRGHSFGWSSWWPQYWNANVVNWMADDFKVDILRAAMGVDASPGYLTGDMTNQKNLVKTVVNAAIAKGVYVIIDWHCEATHQAEAVTFFTEMATTYGSNPNVIYEILNEPTTQTWAQVKTYAAAVIAAIRSKDPDNIIVVGCPQWDQVIRQVADAPLTGYSNIMYTVHFYAASHGQWLRDDCAYAIGKNIPIFVTESSGMDASGSGAINYTEWEAWFTFMEANKISWCNWSISDKVNESCSILVPGAPSNGGWTSAQMKESGNYIRTKIRSFAGGTVAVTGVTVSPTSASVAVNGTTQLTATVLPSNATNKSVTWSTSNSTIATVSTSGLVTGKAAGSATITVKTVDGNKTATSAITVTTGGGSNKILNPGWESGTASWTVGTTFSVSTTDKRTGSYSLKLAGVGGWANTYQTISVTANTNYNYSLYIKGTAKVYMAVYNTAWTTNLASVTKTPTSSWVKYTLSFNSGSNTQLIISMQDAGAGTSYIDDSEAL